VKSRKGIGSSFVIRFLATQSVPELQTPDESRSVPVVQRAVRTIDTGVYSILVVEDDVETQKYMSSILKEEFQLHLVSSSVEAWETLRTVPVDLVLLDLSLKGNEDGLQILSTLRANHDFAAIPVFIVTAHAFPEDKERCLAAGCDRYFSKPFDIGELRDAIEEFLRKPAPSV